MCNQVEKVQNCAARTFLGVNRFAPILSIQGDSGWQLCQTRIHMNMLRYWNRLLKMDNNRLCKHVFMWDYSLSYNNWSCYVKDIFDRINCDNFVGKIPCDIVSCKEKLNSTDNLEWKEKLSFKPKLRTYKQCKDEICVENYVKLNLTSKERSMIAQLRMGILPINLETGRYRNVPADQRFCYNCDNHVEDEAHFVFECPVYEYYRKTLYDNLDSESSFEHMSSHAKLTYLCENYPRQLAKYICHAFSKRQSLIYINN